MTTNATAAEMPAVAPLDAGRRDRASAMRWAVVLAIVLLLLPLAEHVPVIGVIASPFQRVVLTYGLAYGIAVLGFNLLLRYTGLLSFGHAAFFGGAAYASGLLIKYLHVTSMEIFLLAGVATGCLLAALFGFVCVRFTRFFFATLTLALSQVVWALALKYFYITNGTDGLRIPTPTLLGHFVASADVARFLSTTYYYYVVVIFFASVAVLWVIVHSPFGKALQAIRDNETRAQFVGIDVLRYRWNAFVISGAFTGLAGTLWGPLNEVVTPDALHWTFSGKIVFMAVLGGFKSFAGPVLGGVAYNYLETYVIKATVYWQALLGVILVLLVLFMPNGISGALESLGRRLRRTT